MKLDECGGKYYYDEAAAERPVKFVEGYLRHYEDRYAGKPFLLLDWQKQIIRDVFGWKRTDNNLRRFREVYIEQAKGSGKSPFLTAIGLYMLLADGEEGAQIVSAATDFQQALITFDNAKKFINAAPEKLKKLCDCNERIIRVEKTNSKWTVISGTAEGKHGFRPTCCILDEAHEWPNGHLYLNLTSNAFKRSQPLILVATNAGASTTCYAWELHQRAQRVLDGLPDADETLYPVIFAAPKDAAMDDPAGWKAANPSLGHTITIEALEIEAKKARTDHALEARFRRFYMGHSIQGSDKWLDMNHWRQCVRKFKPSEVQDLPCYLSLDMSLVDDLTALAAIWIGKEKLYAKVFHWLPTKTARKYVDRDGTPFEKWAIDKHITLLDEETVNPKVQRRIAKYIEKLSEKYDVKALCFDRARATNTIALVEAKGIVCVDVAQTLLEMSKPSEELVRRLKDKSIVIYPNECLDWQAENVEVFSNNGLIKPCKPGAKGRYAGKRGVKIDGISAIVTGLHRALKHGMQAEQSNNVGVYFFP